MALPAALNFLLLGTAVILVRPDRVIAWRSLTAAEHPAEQIGAAFDHVLARARKPE